MAQVVALACPRCGHHDMYVVESAQQEPAATEDLRASGDRVPPSQDVSAAEARRVERLKSLPSSLPVGGIITPV